MAKFHCDCVKIVDFVVKAYFWNCSDLGATPGILFPKPLVVSNLLILRGIWESCPEKEIENPINL